MAADSSPKFKLGQRTANITPQEVKQQSRPSSAAYNTGITKVDKSTYNADLIRNTHFIDPFEHYKPVGENMWASRYPNYRPYWSEDQWAEIQTSEEVRRNMRKRAWDGFWGSFAGGFKNTSENIGNVLGRDLGGLIVSDAGKKAGERMAAEEVLYPIYTSREMRLEDAKADPSIASSFMKYMPGGADPGRRWAQLGASSGFTLGTLATVAAEELALGALTSYTGGAAAPAAAVRTGKNLNRLRKAFKTMFSSGGDFLKTTKALAATKNVARGAKALGKGGLYTARMANLASYEASMEAGMWMAESKENYIRDYMAENGGELPSSEELAEAYEKIEEGGDFLFTYNMPLLTMSNLIVLPNIIRPAIPFKFGTGFIPKTLFRGGKYKAVGDVVKEGMQKTMGKRLGGLAFGTARLTGKVAKLAGSEGFEEMAQGIGGEAASSMYDPVNGEYADTLMEQISVIGNAAKESMGSGKGWDEFVAGGLMGLGFGGFGAVKTMVTGGKSQLQQNRETAAAMNAAMDDFIQATMFSADNINGATQTQIQAEILKAEQEGDTKRVKDLKNQARASLFMTMHRSGKGKDFVNDLMEQVEIMQEENPEGVELLLNGKTIEETKLELQQQYEQYSKDMDMYTSAFGINEMTDPNEYSATYNAAHFLAASGTKLRDGQARVENLRNDLAQELAESEDGKDADKTFKINEMFEALMDPTKLPAAISSVYNSLETNKEILKNSTNEAEKKALQEKIDKQEQYLFALNAINKQVFDKNGNISDNYDSAEVITTILNQMQKVAPSAVNESFRKKATDLLKINAENQNITFFQNVLTDPKAREAYASKFVEAREIAQAKNALKKAKAGNRMVRGVDTDLANADSMTEQEFDEATGDAQFSPQDIDLVLSKLASIKQNRFTGKYVVNKKKYDTLEEAQDAALDSLPIQVKEKAAPYKEAFKKRANAIAQSKQDPKAVEAAQKREKPLRDRIKRAEKKQQAADVVRRGGGKTVAQTESALKKNQEALAKTKKDIKEAQSELEKAKKAVETENKKKKKDAAKLKEAKEKQAKAKEKVAELKQKQSDLNKAIKADTQYLPEIKKVEEKQNAIAEANKKGDLATELSAIEDLIKAASTDEVVLTKEQLANLVNRKLEIENQGYSVEAPTVGQVMTEEMDNSYDVEEVATEDLPEGMSVVKEVKQPKVSYQSEENADPEVKQKGKVVVAKGIGNKENFKELETQEKIEKNAAENNNPEGQKAAQEKIQDEKETIAANYMSKEEEKAEGAEEKSLKEKIDTETPLTEQERVERDDKLAARFKNAENSGPKTQNEVDNEAARLSRPQTQSSRGVLGLVFDYAIMSLYNAQNLTGFLANAASNNLQKIFASLREKGDVSIAVVKLNDSLIPESEILIDLSENGKDKLPKNATDRDITRLVNRINKKLEAGETVVIKDTKNRLIIISRGINQGQLLKAIEQKHGLYRDSYTGLIREGSANGKIFGSNFNEGQFTEESKQRLGQLRIGDEVQLRIPNNEYNQNLIEQYQRGEITQRDVFANMAIEIVSDGHVVGLIPGSEKNSTYEVERFQRAEQLRTKVFGGKSKKAIDSVVSKVGKRTTGYLAGKVKVSQNFVKRASKRNPAQNQTGQLKTIFVGLEQFEQDLAKSGANVTVEYFVGLDPYTAVDANGKKLGTKEANRQNSPFRTGAIYIKVTDNTTQQTLTTQAVTPMFDSAGNPVVSPMTYNQNDLKSDEFKQELATNIDGSTGQPIISTQVFVDGKSFSSNTNETTNSETVSDKFRENQQKGNVTVVPVGGKPVPVTGASIDNQTDTFKGEGPDGPIEFSLAKIEDFAPYKETNSAARPKNAPQTSARKQADEALARLRRITKPAEVIDRSAVQAAAEIVKIERLVEGGLQLNEDEQKILDNAKAGLKNGGYSIEETKTQGEVLDRVPTKAEAVTKVEEDDTLPEGVVVVKKVNRPAVTKGDSLVSGKGNNTGKPNYTLRVGTKKNTEHAEKKAELKREQEELAALEEQQKTQQTTEPVTEDQKRQKALEDRVKELERKEVEELREEDGSVLEENVAAWKQNKKDIEEAKNKARRGNIPKGIAFNVLDRSSNEILSEEQYKDAEEMIEATIQLVLDGKLTATKAHQLIIGGMGYAFTLNDSQLLQDYINDRTSNAPEIGNNKAPFALWRKGEGVAKTEETVPTAQEQEVVEQAKLALEKKDPETGLTKQQTLEIKQGQLAAEDPGSADAKILEKEIAGLKEAIAVQTYKINYPAAHIIQLQLVKERLRLEKIREKTAAEKKRLSEVNKLIDKMDPATREQEIADKRFANRKSPTAKQKKALDDLTVKLKAKSKEQKRNGEFAERLNDNKKKVKELFPDLSAVADNLVKSKAKPAVKKAEPRVTAEQIAAKSDQVNQLQAELANIEKEIENNAVAQAKADNSNASEVRPSSKNKAIKNAKEGSEAIDVKNDTLQEELNQVNEELAKANKEFKETSQKVVELEQEKLEALESVPEGERGAVAKVVEDTVTGSAEGTPKNRQVAKNNSEAIERMLQAEQQLSEARKKLSTLKKEREALNTQKNLNTQEGLTLEEQQKVTEEKNTERVARLNERQEEISKELAEKKKQATSVSEEQEKALKAVEERADKEVTLEEIQEEIDSIENTESGLLRKVNDIFEQSVGVKEVAKKLKALQGTTNIGDFFTDTHKKKNLELTKRNGKDLVRQIDKRLKELKLAKQALEIKNSQENQEIQKLEQEFDNNANELAAAEGAVEALNQEPLTNEEILEEVAAIENEEEIDAINEELSNSERETPLSPYEIFDLHDSATVEEVQQRFVQIVNENNFFDADVNTKLEILLAYKTLLKERGASGQEITLDELLKRDDARQARIDAVDAQETVAAKQVYIVQYGQEGDVFTMPDGTTYTVLSRNEEEDTITLSKEGYNPIVVSISDGTLAASELELDRQDVEENPPTDAEIMQLLEKLSQGIQLSPRENATMIVHKERIKEVAERMATYSTTYQTLDKFGLQYSAQVMYTLDINMFDDLALIVEKYTTLVKEGQPLPNNLEELMLQAGLSAERVDAYRQNLTVGAYASIWAYATQADILIGEQRSATLREVLGQNAAVFDNQIQRLERMDVSNMTPALLRQALGIPRRIIEDFFAEQSLYLSGTDVMENMTKDQMLGLLGSIGNFIDRTVEEETATQVLRNYMEFTRELREIGLDLNVSTIVLTQEGLDFGTGSQLVFNDSIDFLSEFNDVEMSEKALEDMALNNEVIKVKNDKGSMSEVNVSDLTPQLLTSEQVQSDVKYVNSILNELGEGMQMSTAYIAASHLVNGNATEIVSRIFESSRDVEQVVRYREFTRTGTLKPVNEFFNRETEEKEVENQICK